MKVLLLVVSLSYCMMLGRFVFAQNASAINTVYNGIISVNGIRTYSQIYESRTTNGYGSVSFSPLKLSYQYSPPSCGGANDESFYGSYVSFDYNFAKLNPSSDGKYYLRFTDDMYQQVFIDGSKILPKLKVRINNKLLFDSTITLANVQGNMNSYSTGITNILYNELQDPTLYYQVKISLWPLSNYINGDLKPNGGRSECYTPERHGDITIKNITILARCTDGNMRPDHIDYQNIALPNYASAIGYIRVGSSLNTSLTSGNVTVPSGNKVILEAGTNIQLLPGFTAVSGSTFSASLKNCGGYSFRSQFENDYSQDGSSDLSLGNKVDLIYIYPIPTKDILYIDTELHINSMKIVNSQGSLILIPNSGNKINASSLAAGIYTLLIDSEKGLVAKKFVVE